MLNQFSRSELIFGKHSTEVLANARIAVFGLGGVGGYVTEALARMGVGALDIVDNDTVNITNINRQIVALHSTVGQKKTDAFEKRILDINPNCIVTKYDMFYLPDTRDKIDFSVYDYVVDAVDTVSAKIDIAVRCHELGVGVISSMGTGNKRNPALLKVADIYTTKVCPLARVMRYELKKRNIPSLKVVYSEETPCTHSEDALKEYLENTSDCSGRAVPGSNPFVPPACGLLIASEVIKDILSEM